MKCNVGGVDRVVRIILGLAVIGLGVFYQSWWGAIGLIPLATAALGWCPLYVPMGISSCPKKG
jgi:hypothetical protein